MKKLLTPLFLMLCLLFTACGNDDEPKLELTPEYLEATTWDAQLTGTQTPTPTTISAHFIMQFITKKRGECIAAYDDSDFQGGFDYSINKDMITFSGSLIGNWTVKEHTKNKMVLVSYQPKEWVIVLTRI